MTHYQNNLEHLKDEFRRLDLRMERAVMEFRARRNHDKPDEFRGFYISDKEIDDMMASPDKPFEKIWVEAEGKLTALRSEIDRRISESQRSGVILRLPHLRTVFSLSPFETDIILLALAPELDLRYQKLYAYLQDDVSRKRPSVNLALQLFCMTLEERTKVREVFTETSPLFASSLLALYEDPSERPAPLLSRFLKADDRIVEFLLGSDHIDQRLSTDLRIARWITPQTTMHELIIPEDVKDLLEKVISLVANRTVSICLLHGPASCGKKSVAEAICKRIGRPLLILDLPALLNRGDARIASLPFQTLLRIAFREALLYGSAVYLNNWHELLKDEPMYLNARQAVEQEMERFQGLIFLGSHLSWQFTDPSRYKFVSIELPQPDKRLRQKLWELHLQNGHPVSAEVDSGCLASAFRFTGGQIQRAIAHAGAHANLRLDKGCQITTDDLLFGCRKESTQHIITFAKKIFPKRIWSDLVLHKDTLAQLREFCQQVRYHTKVYRDWGFDQRLSLGKGIIALFSGPSGTGKTLSAEILANELGLDLYKVDLSCVVSKYIGETEKNLSRVFQDAQESNAILFFDEADALFGKRSEVKDAHDRYANIEINYLLQRVEEYEGAIILASNMSKNIDAAFLRRMHFCIEFPFPDENHRFRIWQGIFPSQAPLTDNLDFEFIARKFKIAGGNIKNVALAAAFRAAENGGIISMEHLMLGMKREYQKLGKVCEKAEFEKYYDMVR